MKEKQKLLANLNQLNLDLVTSVEKISKKKQSVFCFLCFTFLKSFESKNIFLSKKVICNDPYFLPLHYREIEM